MSHIHEFGGSWTQAKLDRVSAYLPLFTREFGDSHNTIYFDAFAGTGKIDRRKPKKIERGGFFTFPEPPPIDGSAKRALEIVPSFDRYVFVDNNVTHCRELRKLRGNYPDLEHRVKVRQSDANERVISFCKATNWDDSRAVFFLDPYKTEVKWETLEAIAKTKAADLWYLFPINTTLRILQRKRPPSKSQIQTLDRLFGESDWFQAFYHKWKQTCLTGTQTRTTRHASANDVKDYFVERLGTVFEWVDERPLRLFNSKGPMFCLLFASAIPGKRRAYQTVRDILSISSEAHDFPARFEMLRTAKKTRPK